MKQPVVQASAEPIGGPQSLQTTMGTAILAAVPTAGRYRAAHLRGRLAFFDPSMVDVRVENSL